MQREALIEKLQGVSDEEARRAPTVSSLSLLSLVKHSAIWERRWFQVVVAGRSFVGECPKCSHRTTMAFGSPTMTPSKPLSRTTESRSLLRRRSSGRSISTRRAHGQRWLGTCDGSRTHD